MRGDSEEKTDSRGDEKDWLRSQAASVLIEGRWLCFSGSWLNVLAVGRF